MNISVLLWQTYCVNIIHCKSRQTTWLQCLRCSKYTFGLMLNFHLRCSYRNADVVLFVGLVKISVMWVPVHAETPNKLCKVLQCTALVWPFQYRNCFPHFPHRLVWLPAEAEVNNKPINMQNIEQSSSAHSHQPNVRLACGCRQDGEFTLGFLSLARLSLYLLNHISVVYWSKWAVPHVSTGWLIQWQK